LYSSFIYIVVVDILATAAAFIGTTVHQVSLWRTVSNHRCVEVVRTPRLGSGAKFTHKNFVQQCMYMACRKPLPEPTDDMVFHQPWNH